MFAAMSKGNEFMINNIYLYVYQDDGDIFNRLKIIDFKLFFITLHPSIHLFPRDGQSGGTNIQLGFRFEIGFPGVLNQ